MCSRKTLNKSFDKLRTNGKLLISFVVSLSNHERNPPVQCLPGASINHGYAGALALLLCGTAASAAQLPLRIGPHAFQVEVAATPQARQRGLMGRTHLAADGGMLFVFEQPGRHCFWMRDTPLPLSIAFIDAAGRIASLADMQPRSESLHCPNREVRYALEVRQGEFQRRGITPRTQVDGLPQ